MYKTVGVIALFFSLNISLFSQEIITDHKVERVGQTNEYNIETTISGLNGVDIARIKYIVSEEHTYKASPKNAFFSDRNAEHIKFYIMGIPNEGVITINLGLELNESATSIEFPVEFQYSRNEQKQTVNLPTIKIGEPLVADASEVVEDPVVETKTIVEEVPIIDEAPPVEDIPIVEEVENEPIEEPVVEEESPEAEIPVEEMAVEEPAKEPVVESMPEEASKEEVPSLEVVEEPITEVVVEEAVEAPEEIVVETPIVEENIEEPVVVPVPPVAETTSRNSAQYTVQILALSDFSQSRLNTYCKEHNLSLSKISKKQVNGFTKIRYGSVNSMDEAKALRKTLINQNVQGAFIIKQ
jgi:hypothetical protein